MTMNHLCAGYGYQMIPKRFSVYDIQLDKWATVKTCGGEADAVYGIAGEKLSWIEADGKRIYNNRYKAMEV